MVNARLMNKESARLSNTTRYILVSSQLTAARRCHTCEIVKSLPVERAELLPTKVSDWGVRHSKSLFKRLKVVLEWRT